MKYGKIVIMVGMVLLLLTACRHKEPESVSDFSWNQVSSYSTTTNLDNGQITATVSAPDYAAIIEELLKNDPSEKLTTTALEKAVKEYPDKIKEYTFEVTSEDEETVRLGFLDQVSFEIIISGIANMEPIYTDQWEAD